MSGAIQIGSSDFSWIRDKRRLGAYLLLFLAALSLMIVVYNKIIYWLLLPILKLPETPGGVVLPTVALLLFSIAHSAYSLGWRLSLSFLVLTTLISWVFEQVGVETGLIYGAYYYTDTLGPKLGHVPILIPSAWFMMVYPSYAVANLIIDKQPTGSRGSLIRVLWLAAVSAVIMTAWDLTMDHVMSGPDRQAWVWQEQGAYFGVPLQNFVGWMVTTFSVYTAYRLLEWSWGTRPMGEIGRFLALMPIIAYSSAFIADIFYGQPEAFRIISPFLMGPPVLLAIGQLFSRK